MGWMTEAFVLSLQTCCKALRAVHDWWTVRESCSHTALLMELYCSRETENAIQNTLESNV